MPSLQTALPPELANNTIRVSTIVLVSFDFLNCELKILYIFFKYDLVFINPIAMALVLIVI